MLSLLFVAALWSPAGKWLTSWLLFMVIHCVFVAFPYGILGQMSSLQCYSVLSDILVKNELCIPLERGSNVLSTGEGFICLSLPSKIKSQCFSVLSTKRQFRSVL